ncbi:MAG: DUF86 domain-containing protein [Phycisphaerales bacterium]|nr:DUF86 domain-containing protein [Phycisphaerales bacterium]
MPRDPVESRISDRIRYEHMMQASKAAMQFVQGRQRADLDKDDMLRRALLHAIQEIGEAASRMSDAGRTLSPKLAWGSIVQMRHIMVHVYWGVDLDRVWSVAVSNMQEICDAAEQAITKLPLPDSSSE